MNSRRDNVRAMRHAQRDRGTYNFEATLVAHFARCLRSGDTPWGAVRVGFEFDYKGGSADVVALSDAGTLLAFEAKLARWREALHQAYRTRCFAQCSYVVLPRRTATKVVSYEAEFRRRRVGLCTINEAGAISILIESAPDTPLQPWMRERAVAELSKGKGGRCRQTQSSKQSRKQSAQLAA